MQGIYGTYRYHYTLQEYKILHTYNLLITIIKIHINDYLLSIKNTCTIHLTVHLDVTLKWSLK